MFIPSKLDLSCLNNFIFCNKNYLLILICLPTLLKSFKDAYEQISKMLDNLICDFTTVA